VDQNAEEGADSSLDAAECNLLAAGLLLRPP
jgi:hypothetical protein